MANWVQGTMLGFGVSGNEQASLLKSLFSNPSQWHTGGRFGLEASVPGLVASLQAHLYYTAGEQIHIFITRTNFEEWYLIEKFFNNH